MEKLSNIKKLEDNSLMSFKKWQASWADSDYRHSPETKCFLYVLMPMTALCLWSISTVSISLNPPSLIAASTSKLKYSSLQGSVDFISVAMAGGRPCKLMDRRHRWWDKDDENECWDLIIPWLQQLYWSPLEITCHQRFIPQHSDQLQVKSICSGRDSIT